MAMYSFDEIFQRSSTEFSGLENSFLLDVLRFLEKLFHWIYSVSCPRDTHGRIMEPHLFDSW